MKRANVWDAPLYRPSHGIPYSVKTGVNATATSGMPLPRATRGNVYNISEPRVRLKWRVCAIASSHDLAPFERGLTLIRSLGQIL